MTGSPLPWLDGSAPTAAFPDPKQALAEPDGLLAAGGDLHPERLLNAYRSGIFPWYDDEQPILWWSPDPRCILLPEAVHVSRSLARRMARKDYEIRFDTAFEQVISACAAPRADHEGTWITQQMQLAYTRLHSLGYAHSVELWLADELVGGLYGVAIGNAFCGESMYSRVPNASKIILVELSRWLGRHGFAFLDCQMPTEHLTSMGAITIRRSEFLARLEQAILAPDRPSSWSLN